MAWLPSTARLKAHFVCTPDEIAKAKHLFYSKTFWFNVATLAATYGNVLPPKYAGPVMTIGNILLRLITNQACTIFPNNKEQP